MLDWIKNFDVVKAILLGAMSVLASWYDLKGEVRSLKKEAEIRWANQAEVDRKQDASAKELRDDVKEGLRDIKQSIEQVNARTARSH